MLVVTDNQFTALRPGEAPLVMGGGRRGGGFGTYGATFTEVMLADLIPTITTRICSKWATVG